MYIEPSDTKFRFSSIFGAFLQTLRPSFLADVSVETPRSYPIFLRGIIRE